MAPCVPRGRAPADLLQGPPESAAKYLHVESPHPHAHALLVGGAICPEMGARWAMSGHEMAPFGMMEEGGIWISISATSAGQGACHANGKEPLVSHFDVDCMDGR